VYVDDLHPVGISSDHCFAVAHQTAARLGYLGIQNASWKTCPSSQTPGAWAGVIVVIEDGQIYLTTSQEKWDKAKNHLIDIQEEIASSGRLCHKPLERKRGFFVHLQRVYPALTPYLKGIHLTLDSWRPGRDEDGWRIPGWTPEESDDEIELPTSSGAPEFVIPVPHLSDDLTSLAQLLQSPTPPRQAIRPKHVTSCVYGFADASSTGFGSTLQHPTGTLPTDMACGAVTPMLIPPISENYATWSRF
jgi:hypothetical protein